MTFNDAAHGGDKRPKSQRGFLDGKPNPQVYGLGVGWGLFGSEAGSA